MVMGRGWGSPGADKINGGELCLEVWRQARTAVKPHLQTIFMYNPHPNFTVDIFKKFLVWVIGAKIGYLLLKIACHTGFATALNQLTKPLSKAQEHFLAESADETVSATVKCKDYTGTWLIEPSVHTETVNEVYLRLFASPSKVASYSECPTITG